MRNFQYSSLSSDQGTGYEFPIQRNNKIDVIREWGPAWKISFELNIASFFNDGEEWGNVFHFTTGNDCCDIGDRIPALFTRYDDRLLYSTNIDEIGNKYTYSNGDINTNTWYSFDIEQYFVSNQLINTLKVMEYGTGKLIWNLELPNNDLQMFYNVQVYAGDDFYNPSNATIRNFQYSSLSSDQCADSECCFLKVVGGVEYELVGKISNPGNYECLNGCTYAVVGGNPEVEYCFKRGYKKAVCQSEKEETKIYFQVRGQTDAHVLFSEEGCNNCECPDCNGYEIVIGGWTNTQSVIRDAKATPYPGYAVTSTPGILSPEEYREFYISLRMEVTGAQKKIYVGVGKRGENPFMSYSLDYTHPINYIGFASWHTITNEYIFKSEKFSVAGYNYFFIEDNLV